jgi:hypothetical protein
MRMEAFEARLHRLLIDARNTRPVSPAASIPPPMESAPLSSECKAVLKGMLETSGRRDTFAAIRRAAHQFGDADGLDEGTYVEMLDFVRDMDTAVLPGPTAAMHAFLKSPPRKVSFRAPRVPPRDPLVAPTTLVASTGVYRIHFIPSIAAGVAASRAASHWLLKTLRHVAAGEVGSVSPLTSDSACSVAVDENRVVVGICAVAQIDMVHRLAPLNLSSLSLGSPSESQELPPIAAESSASLSDLAWASSRHGLSASAFAGSFCGVQLVWVAPAHRNKGVATALVDAARKSLVYRFEFPRAHCAFSQPTADGKLFALRFTGRDDFFTFL